MLRYSTRRLGSSALCDGNAMRNRAKEEQGGAKRRHVLQRKSNAYQSNGFALHGVAVGDAMALLSSAVLRNGSARRRHGMALQGYGMVLQGSATEPRCPASYRHWIREPVGEGVMRTLPFARIQRISKIVLDIQPQQGVYYACKQATKGER